MYQQTIGKPLKGEADFRAHIICLTALFVMGEAVIAMPYKTADERTFLGFLIVAVLSIGLFALISPIANVLYYENNCGKCPKWAKVLFCVIAAVYAAFIAKDCFMEFVKFVSSVILPDVAITIIGLIFVAVLFWTARQGSRAVLKFSVISFIFISGVIVLFFIFSFSQFRLQNIILFQWPKTDVLIKQSRPYFMRMVLPIFIIPIYQATVLAGSGKKQTVWGVACGFVALAICLLNALLLFSANFACKLDYPYADAISTVTLGELFSRMDGFSYFIYFACSLVKVSVCIAVVRAMLCRMDILLKKA